MFDNTRGREWAAMNIKTVDRFIDNNEKAIEKTRSFAQWVVIVTGFALMRKRFKK